MSKNVPAGEVLDRLEPRSASNLVGEADEQLTRGSDVVAAGAATRRRNALRAFAAIAERAGLVSVRIPSRFRRSLLTRERRTLQARLTTDVWALGLARAASR